MYLFATILSLVSILSSIPLATSQKLDNDCAQYGISPAWHDRVVEKFQEFWSVDDAATAAEIATEVFSPDMAFYLDRLPGANDSVVWPPFGLENYLAFWNISRLGFEPYDFLSEYHFGFDDKVTLRWTLNATLKEPEKTFPGTTAPPGTQVACNGTDVFFINRCTGLVDRIDATQDFITYYNALGFGPIIV